MKFLTDWKSLAQIASQQFVVVFMIWLMDFKITGLTVLVFLVMMIFFLFLDIRQAVRD